MFPRDQELRFTVHEAPDYYQLKVSIFNDDKKSELIGEGWVDLKEVVIPGGGQSDQWYPLQYKGKYAGDVRMELTYYDIRPRDEAVIERRREGDRNTHGSRNHTPNQNGGVDGPRHFGPREIKRRPLPADPTGSSPLPTRPALPEHPYSSPGPYLTQVHNTQPAFRDSWHPPSQETFTNPSTPNHDPYASSPYDFTLPPRGQVSEQPRDFGYHDDSFNSSNHDDYDQPETFPDPHENSYTANRQAYQPQPLPPTPYTNRFDERRHSAQASFPEHDPNYQPSPQYGSSPPSQPPFPGSVESRQRVQFNRYSTSPVKNDMYRDSPLRQSMSQSHFGYAAPFPPSKRYQDHDAPPPPPVHRESNVGSGSQQLRLTDIDSVQVPEPLQIGPAHRKMSVDDRSPLQSLERQYDPRLQPKPSMQFADQPSAITGNSSANQYSPNQPRPRAHSQDPPASFNNMYTRTSYGNHPSEPQVRPRMSASPIPVDREREIYGPGGRGSQLYNEPSPMDQRSGMRTSTAGVPLVRPRAISPDARSTTRKSVSPQPSARSDERSMSSVPFGPDDYDMFNPSSVTSPAASGPEERYETPEQAMEAARQKEVQKIREQGPIIGNDGRVIDPSDHLPTDTWAPEPERKKKPEVVIRFKAGGAPRTPASHGSSPAPTRPQVLTTPTSGSSPAPLPMNSSPVEPSAQRTFRNRLQKSQPPRPLPQQPFQHANSSPSVPMSSQQGSSPRFEAPPRHSTSEYPLREHYNYGNAYNSSPRSPTYAQGPPPVPAKVPLQNRSMGPGHDGYGGYGHVDALAAEMNSIDIGTGNGGRGPRTRRNY